ncbi:MAG: isoprenylcysteine carboxylmethyltransferase family protein [Salinisphaeraceae bacterium]|nr:isoprenylcysteine carboxylmethyltransferase family protein [Salinisphaeraceae bacterium]
MPKPAQDSAGVAFPPPLMFLLAVIGGVILQFMFPLPFLPWQWGMALGAISLLAGVGLILSAALLFVRAGTALPPWAAASAVVVQGPYRFTRNPMYLGMACIHASIGLAFTSWWILLSLIPTLWWVNKRVILKEEAYMAEKFGQPYKDYCASVRRWL